MKKLDYFLMDYRHKMAIPYIKTQSIVLDIGGYDGSFLKKIEDKMLKGVCIDPLSPCQPEGKIQYIQQKVESSLPFPNNTFDIVCMLAVFEHLGSRREEIAKEIYRVLRKDGIVVLTVPHSFVDNIVDFLRKIKLLDGMSVEEHKKFNHKDTVRIFESVGFKLKKWIPFQLGLNNLFVFSIEKSL